MQQRELPTRVEELPAFQVLLDVKVAVADTNFSMDQATKLIRRVHKLAETKNLPCENDAVVWEHIQKSQNALELKVAKVLELERQVEQELNPKPALPKTEKKRKELLPQEAKDRIWQWLQDHGYQRPSKEDMALLAKETSLTETQVRNWISNALSRYLCA